MKMDESNCLLCGRSYPDHETLNHEFSITGQLIAKEVRSKEKVIKTNVNTADPVLRALLIGKGIITAEDLRVTPEREVRDESNKHHQEAPE